MWRSSSSNGGVHEKTRRAGCSPAGLGTNTLPTICPLKELLLLLPLLLRPARGDLEGDAGVAADVLDGLGRAAVDDEGIDLREMADAHRRRAGELHGIRYQDHFSGIGDDGLGGAHL